MRTVAEIGAIDRDMVVELDRQYDRAANELCTSLASQLDQQTKGASGGGTDSVLPDDRGSVVSQVTRTVDDLRKLVPPVGTEALLSSAYDQLEELARLVEQRQVAEAAADDAEVSRLTTEVGRIGVALAAVLDQQNLDDCSTVVFKLTS